MYEKKILLIIPKFFSYEMYIYRKLQSLGFKVYMVYENIDEFSLTSKALVKLFGSKMDYYDQYYKRKIKRNLYDYVLVIRGSNLSLKILNDIKSDSPNAKTFMYQWDSVKNNPNAENIAPCFDKVFTFDMEDAKKYDWKYRPLFYLYTTLREERREFEVSYICTLHSHRVKIYKELMKNQCSKYLYMYSKFSHFIKEKLIKKNLDFRGASWRDIEFSALSLEQSNAVMSKSNIIVDYTHPDQNGFTMRTCEAIGHRCKLVTNNPRVKEADFYNENNVYVYDMDNLFIPDYFLSSSYIDLSENVYERYSLDYWIKDILAYD